MSQWKNFTEVILNLGAGEAYLEYYKDVKVRHKSEPSEEDFRKKVIFFASKRASYEEKYLKNHEKEFHEYFGLAKGRLERKEAEDDLEKIVQKWLKKLKEETSE